MTTTEKISAIHAACIEVNPEIMELKFGCFFKWNYDTWCVNCARCDDTVYAFSCTGDKHSWPLEYNEKENWRFKWDRFGKERMEEMETLGRPIRLADVLLAIAQTDNEPGNWFVDMQGNFWEIENGMVPTLKDCFPSWNLRKDSIYDQDEATIDFIHQVLKGV